MFVNCGKARIAPALKRPLFVDTSRVRAVVALVGALVNVHTGVPIASVTSLAEARVVGAQIAALSIRVARVALGTKVGPFADHAALSMWLDSLLSCAVQLGAFLHRDIAAIEFTILRAERGDRQLIKQLANLIKVSD